MEKSGRVLRTLAFAVTALSMVLSKRRWSAWWGCVERRETRARDVDAGRATLGNARATRLVDIVRWWWIGREMGRRSGEDWHLFGARPARG